jgi:hypothetical protein
LLRQIREKKLLIYASLLDGELSQHPGAQEFLWRIREYYITNAVDMPPGLSNAFRNLPADRPRPSRNYYHGSGSIIDHIADMVDKTRH